jgi:hypothetical protein
VAWRVVVRRGPQVERLRADSLAAALDLLENRVRQVAMGPRPDAVDVRVRRYDPVDLVWARAEVRGPQRFSPDVRAGVDLRGDGSVVAWTGSVRRAAVEPGDGESPYDALRRALER